MAGARLELIYGCMFAGKTTELIRRLSDARSAGLVTVAIKPRTDVRSGIARLATHAGGTFQAVDAAGADAIPAAAGGAQVLGIDEAHFFGAALVPVCRTLLSMGLRVIVAGVHLDHRGQPFDPFPELLPLADETVQLFAACARCGRPAIHSHRKDTLSFQDRIVVGGADRYEPLCEACFPPTP